MIVGGAADTATVARARRLPRVRQQLAGPANRDVGFSRRPLDSLDERHDDRRQGGNCGRAWSWPSSPARQFGERSASQPARAAICKAPRDLLVERSPRAAAAEDEELPLADRPAEQWKGPEAEGMGTGRAHRPTALRSMLALVECCATTSALGRTSSYQAGNRILFKQHQHPPSTRPPRPSARSHIRQGQRRATHRSDERTASPAVAGEILLDESPGASRRSADAKGAADPRNPPSPPACARRASCRWPS